jgi:hypothetical protein
MDKDRDLSEAGEALLAALAEHAADTPPALRERVLGQAVRRERPRQISWRLPAVIAGSFVMCVLLAASLAWGLSVNQALAQERTLRAQLQEAAAKDEVVFDIVDGRNVTKTTLHPPTDDSPTAPYGKVFIRPDMPYVVAMAGRLPPAVDGQEYHLYLDAERIGTIAPNDGGFGYLVYRAERIGIVYAQARVILESPQSTTATGSLVLVSPVK